MSVISNVHQVVNYDAKKSVAYTGQRLSKVTYKTDKESGIKKDSKCVSLPLVTSNDVQDSIHIIMPAIISYLQDCQDKIVRSKVDTGATDIFDTDINMSAIAEFMAEESTGGRLTKEYVSEWFKNTIEDNLMLALADKLGVGETPSQQQVDHINAAIGIYKDKISGLAGGKTSYPAEIADKLLKALSFAPDGDEIAGKFVVRLEKMKEVATIDLLAL